MWDLGIPFIPPLEEDHVPKLLKKKIQKERVENVMKNGGQRIAIDFTLSEDMSNKVSTFSFKFCMKPELLFFLVLFVCFFGEREEFYGIFVAREEVSLFLHESILQRGFALRFFCSIYLKT